VKVIIGIDNERGETFIDFMKRMEVKTFKDPEIRTAYQNIESMFGILSKKRNGRRNGSAKTLKLHATTYSSTLLRLLLLKRFFVASEIAADKDRKNHSMINYCFLRNKIHSADV
jgi:hypothetical protein